MPSRRVMPSQPSSPEYAEGMAVRRVGDNGYMKFGGIETPVSRLLANEPVGLLPIADDVWELYYGAVLLAHVSLKNKALEIRKLR